MTLRLITFTAVALCGIGLASYQLLVKGTVQQAKAGTYVPSGEVWIDEIARHSNRQMWLALTSSDYKMMLEETRGVPSEKTIQQTLKYKADPKSSEVVALKSLFKKRFCSGFLASDLREMGLTKTLLFTDTNGRVLNKAILSDENCARYR